MREPLGDGEGTIATVRRAACSLSSPSSTAIVISSTKRGMPSVRSTISAITSAGSSLLPTRCAMMTRASRSPSRLSIRLVYMRLAHPRCVELRAERHDEKHGKGFNLVHGSAKRLQARWINPMRVLEDHQYRFGTRQRFSICALSASSVRCLRRSGVRSIAG